VRDCHDGGSHHGGPRTQKQGVATSASDTTHLTCHGTGAHGSVSDCSIEPIIEGIHYVNDVQAVISRQHDAHQFAALTVGSFNAGTVRLEPAAKPGGSGSEDYPESVTAGMAKSVYFMVVGYDPQMTARDKAEGQLLPVNHLSFFTPVPETTIRAGVETLSIAGAFGGGKQGCRPAVTEA
jgi:hypothetical protein